MDLKMTAMSFDRQGPGRGHFCLLALNPDLLAMENLDNATEEDIEATIDFILRTHGTPLGKK